MRIVPWLRSIIVLALLLLMGCAKRSEAAPHAANAQGSAGATVPKAGGELVFAFDGAAISQFALDPHKSAYAPHHRVMRSIFDSLIVALPGHRFGPWLAKSWEVAPNGLSYTFKLREDVTFHDGTRFDAAAVKFTLDRIKEPKNALVALSDIGPYAESEVVDDFTVVVRFTAPYAPFLANLSKTSLGIVSPSAVRKYGDSFAAHPVGTGPFRFRSLQQGTEIVLERNRDYRWPAASSAHEGPAHIERLTFKNVPEEATRVAVLLSGQAGAVDLVPPQNLISLRSASEYQIISGELLNQNHSLYLNVRREPWTDARMREAFKRAIDLDAAVKTIYLGTQARAWSPLSPSLFGYDKTLEGSWKADRASAARILDELGWKKGDDGVRVRNGKRLTVVFLDTQGNREKRLDLITVLRRQLRDAGFDLRIDSQPSGSYQQKSLAGDFDLLAGSLFAPDPDVLRRIHSASQRTGLGISKVEDPELDALLEAGAAELDTAKRASLYKQAQRLILDRTYAIPTYVLLYTIAAQQKVQGVAIDAHGFPVFYDSWIRS